MYNYNPYYGQQPYAQPRYQSIEPPYLNQQSKGLLGKPVDSIDAVKAIDVPLDIPLDGSVSYFPLTDGSAIVTKQLQNDGTIKIVVYKPTQEDKKETIKFATLDDIQNLRDDVQEIKKQLKEFKTNKSKDDEQ